MVNEYIEFTFDLTNINSEINMNSNEWIYVLLMNILYILKNTFSEIYTIVKTLNENNELYYLLQTDTNNNKILV